jgi:hypothetical protein
MKAGCVAAILAVVFLLAIPTYLIIQWIREPFGPAEYFQSREPLSVAEARKLTGFPFPSSARNIRFAHFRHWVGYEDFVRFEAPSKDCITFAEQVIAAKKSPGDDKPADQLAEFGWHVDRPIATCRELNIDWFDVEKINRGTTGKRGMVGGRGPSHAPKVWIDLERGVCYYWSHD